MKLKREFEVLEGLTGLGIDLAKTASSSDIIYDALRDGIISGQIKAGESLRQEHVAKLFNVSRIPVREALNRLEAQGLVQSLRYKGYVVSLLSPADVEEIYEVRATLEPMVIEKSVAMMTPETLEEARKYCELFSSETDSSKWGEWNRLFHGALYKDAKRPFHLKLIGEAIDRVDSYIRAQLVLTNGMEKARKEHLEILAACVEGDGELAGKRTRKHILGSYKVLRKYLDNQ
ncbi:GntR family transcriptional regulator [Kiloniella laminariae]|uniref:GntR family transcriptional regulator n=1 Tax=Kiloniella laminariae TaxID=454162 RepID=UPI001B7F8C96|nr:GntR family transcriptional regulator [Kiloniella laminariae]